jgi:hypothetical protein
VPPLSDHDRAALARIEAHLAIDDPDLALALTMPPHRRARIPRHWHLPLMIVGLAASILVPTLIAILR